jgi:uncharacterized protein
MANALVSYIERDLKEAMKAGDTTARDSIRFTLAAIKNESIDKRGELSEEETVAVLQREAKRRRDSIEQFRAAGRSDLVENEENQLAVLSRYLPAELSEEQLEAMVSEVISETGAASPKDIGTVMPVLLERSKGATDGKRLSQEVRRQLSRS